MTSKIGNEKVTLNQLGHFPFFTLVFQNPPGIPWVWRCEFGTPKGLLASGGGPGCLELCMFWILQKDDELEPYIIKHGETRKPTLIKMVAKDFQTKP